MKDKKPPTSSLHTFVKQFIATAVAPTETSPKTLKYYYDQWRQDCRNNDQSNRILEDRYEQKYNQPRMALEAARRQFEAQAGLLHADNKEEFFKFMDNRPVSKARDIYTKHILE